MSTTAAKQRRTRHVALTPEQKGEVTKQIRKALRSGSELKYFVTAAQVPATSSNWTTAPLCLITQGVGDVQRVGDTITLDRLWMRFNSQCNLSDTSSGKALRMIIFQWQPSSALAPGDVLDVLLTHPPASAETYLSQYSHDNRQMYRILWDKTFVVNSIASGGEKTRWYVSEEISLASAAKTIQYNSGTTDGTNQIYLGYASDSSSNPPTLEYDFKLTYYDA